MKDQCTSIFYPRRFLDNPLRTTGKQLAGLNFIYFRSVLADSPEVPGKSHICNPGVALAKEILAANATEDPVGRMFSDRYQVLSLVGEGGMGLVYKAKHVLMQRHVAIKILRNELKSNSVLLSRFKQEAQAVSKLKHPNIVSVYDFGVTEQGLPFLVMDYLDGVSLAETIIVQRCLPLDRALYVFQQACRALEHAHAKGVIHRDFKSSNIVLCNEDGKTDVVKVVDFGMAKLMRPDEDANEFQELTQTGDVFGSPLYMSPEQCRGQKLDERSDIYSLGCVMYYAISGHPPCRGENVLDTLQRQINETPVPLSQLNPKFPSELDEVILKALRKEPELRYQSVTEMLTDIDSIVNGGERVIRTAQMKRPEVVVGPQETLLQGEITERSLPRVPVVHDSSDSALTASGAGSAAVPVAPPVSARPGVRLFSHNIELSIVFAVFLSIIIGMTAFIYGRMFEEADLTKEEGLWQELNQAGDDARVVGDYPVAERSYKQAMVEAMKGSKRNPRLAKTLVSLGAVYAEDKQYSRSEAVLKRAQTVLERCYGAECPELSTVFVIRARSYDEQGKRTEAADLRKRAMILLENSAGKQQRSKLQKK